MLSDSREIRLPEKFNTRNFPPDGTTFQQIVLGQKLAVTIPPFGYLNVQFFHQVSMQMRRRKGKINHSINFITHMKSSIQLICKCFIWLSNTYHSVLRTLHTLHLICMFHAVPHLDFTPVEMRCLHILIITLWKLSLASRNTQEVSDLLRLVTNICSTKLSFPQLSKISGCPWNSNPTNRLNIVRFCNNSVKHQNKTIVPSRT